MSELGDIFSQDKDLKIGDKTIKIKGVTLGDLPVVIKLVSKYFELVPKSGKPDYKLIATKILSDDFESVLKIFEIATDLTPIEIKKLNMGAVLLVLTHFVKDNADFFYQNVLPILSNLADLKKDLDGTTKSKS